MLMKIAVIKNVQEEDSPDVNPGIVDPQQKLVVSAMKKLYSTDLDYVIISEDFYLQLKLCFARIKQ